MKIITKKKIKKYLSLLIPLIIIWDYFYDYFRFLKYSGVLGFNKKQKMIGAIIASYHVVEKGLTMPDTRLGFGKDNLTDLIDKCIYFIQKYGLPEPQVEHAIAVIFEYKKFHELNNFVLSNDILNKYQELDNFTLNQKLSTQNHFTNENYFESINSSFPLFSESRKSIRDYSDKEVSMDILQKAVALAQHAPSACNRQSVRVHIYSDKEKVQNILSLQKANRGFGHLANKVIIVTSELGVYHGLKERNAGFVDGGIFSMNLLYSLHYYKIAACSLNCSFSMQTEKKLRKVCNINKSESFVLIISIGYPPDNFKSALSVRYPMEYICNIHE